MTEAKRKAILRKRFGSILAFSKMHGEHRIAIRTGWTRKKSTMELFETFGIKLQLLTNHYRQEGKCCNINAAEIAKHVQRGADTPGNVMVLLDIKNNRWKIRVQKAGCATQEVIDGVTVGSYTRGCLSAQIRGDIKEHMKQ